MRATAASSAPSRSPISADSPPSSRIAWVERRRSRVRLGRGDDGAWWIGLTCWLAGWAAASELAWEPLALAAAAAPAFFAAQYIRGVQRSGWTVSLPCLLLPLAALLPAAAALGWLVDHLHEEGWAAAMVMPAVLYGGIVIAGLERLAVSRLTAIAAISSAAPATYILAGGEPGSEALILWISLGGYFFLASLFVLARFRRSKRFLLAARGAAALAVWAAIHVEALGPARWPLLAAALVFAIRVWTYRASVSIPNRRRVGYAELAHTALTAALVLAALKLH